MNHSDVRDEQQHALILQLTAERDALKAGRAKWELDAIADVRRVEAENERLRAERYALLGVKTKEGLTASEWLMRTALAEARLTELREALKEIDAKQRAAHDWNTPLNGRCPECGYNTELLEAILAKLTP